MTKLKQAARQALEAWHNREDELIGPILENALTEYADEKPVAWLIPGGITRDKELAEANGDKAIPLYTALREALAEQAEQEPVAWWFQPPNKNVRPMFDTQQHGGKWQPLYAAPVEPVKQEPVGVVTKDSLDGVVKWNGWIPREGTKLYAAPIEPVKQEPVAWMDLHKELGKLRWMGGDEGWDNAINAVRDRLIELATPHPVRTKDLTDDEIHKAFYSKNTGLINGIRAVIAADREKNRA